MSLEATSHIQQAFYSQLDVGHYERGEAALKGVLARRSEEELAMDPATTATYVYAKARAAAAKRHGIQGFALSDLTRSPDVAWALQGAVHDLQIGIALGIPLQGLEARVGALFLRASQEDSEGQEETSSTSDVPDPSPRGTPRSKSGSADVFVDDSHWANAPKSLIEPTPHERHTDNLSTSRAAPTVSDAAMLVELRVSRHIALLEAVCAECELWDEQHPDPCAPPTSAVPALSPTSPAGLPSAVHRRLGVVHGPLSQNRQRHSRTVTRASYKDTGAHRDLLKVVTRQTSFRRRGTIMDGHDHRSQSGFARSVGTVPPEQHRHPYA